MTSFVIENLLVDEIQNQIQIDGGISGTGPTGPAGTNSGKATVGTGGEYSTVNDAWNAGERNIILVSDVTETASNASLSGTYHLEIPFGFTWNTASQIFFAGSSTFNINGAGTWSMDDTSTSRTFLGTGARFTIRDITLNKTSGTDGPVQGASDYYHCTFTNNGGLWELFFLPNPSGGESSSIRKCRIDGPNPYGLLINFSGADSAIFTDNFFNLGYTVDTDFIVSSGSGILTFDNNVVITSTGIAVVSVSNQSSFSNNLVSGGGMIFNTPPGINASNIIIENQDINSFAATGPAQQVIVNNCTITSSTSSGVWQNSAITNCVFKDDFTVVPGIDNLKMIGNTFETSVTYNNDITERFISMGNDFLGIEPTPPTGSIQINNLS